MAARLWFVRMCSNTATGVGWNVVRQQMADLAGKGYVTWPGFTITLLVLGTASQWATSIQLEALKADFSLELAKARAETWVQLADLRTEVRAGFAQLGVRQLPKGVRQAEPNSVSQAPEALKK